jgi:DNA-binding beta-propeller fold protein YncE
MVLQRAVTWTIMKTKLASAFIFLFLGAAYTAKPATLTAGQPIVLENTKGNFDFIRVDAGQHRLLLAHTGNKTLDVFDLESKKLLKSVPTGAAQDSATDAKNHLYYASVSSPPRMAIVDASKLEMIGEVPLPAAADLMTFSAETGMAYVCNDTAGEVWVIDPQTKKIVTTITFPGKGMEDLAFNPHQKRFFQVVKSANLLALVDAAENKVLETWPTAPATNPHGMALVPHEDTLLIAGTKLALFSRADGKVLASADIAPRVDEMAYDPDLHFAYCGSSQGKISVVKIKDNTLTAIEDISTPGGAKSIVVDPKTRLVWIAYSKGEQSFVQPFSPQLTEELSR